MPEEEKKTGGEISVDIDTSGPEVDVSISTGISPPVFFSSSGIVSPFNYVSTYAGCLLDPELLLKFRHH